MKTELTVDELKREKLAMEKEIIAVIKKFVYDTNTIPKNVNVEINTAKSFTNAVILTDGIKVTSDLEI
ncbi:MAG: hypothetical protein GY707_05615 [Desulfobacteraceae bacterium]|nr:hypothetical protein [Desulfobacteraceae bacterium]